MFGSGTAAGMPSSVKAALPGNGCQSLAASTRENEVPLSLDFRHMKVALVASSFSAIEIQSVTPPGSRSACDNTAVYANSTTTPGTAATSASTSAL